MSGVFSFTKKRVLTPGLFSFCHVGNLSCGKKVHLERMLWFHRADIILYPSSSSLFVDGKSCCSDDRFWKIVLGDKSLGSYSILVFWTFLCILSYG